MRLKLLTGAATLALAAPILVAVEPAASQNWQHYGNATAGAPDFTAGTAGNTLAAISPLWGTSYCGYYPGCPHAQGYLYMPRYDYRSRR
jgi:hypothetical protein